MTNRPDLSDDLQIIAPNPADHAEPLFAMLALIWSETDQHCREGRINHSHYDWATSRIGFVDQTLVTHYGVYDLTMRIGSIPVRTAGVNLVGTHPDYRRQGLMHQTTQASLAAMRQQGYDISVLCNAIPNYYDRFGYVFAWPELSFDVDAAALPTTISPPDFQPFSTRRLTETLRAAMDRLYNAENEGLSGTVIRPSYRLAKVPGDDDGFYWTDPAGSLSGYALAEANPNRGIMWHEDSAGEPDTLFSILGHLAHKHGCKTVRFSRLHPDSALGQRVRRLNHCQMTAKYWHNGGFMIRIINWAALFDKLAPLLSRRLQEARLGDWQGYLRLAGDEDGLTLAIDAGQVRVAPPTDTPHRIQGGPELAQLVIGTETPEEIAQSANIELSGDAAVLMRALFPKQAVQLSNADL